VEFDPASPDNTLSLRLSLWRSALNLLAHHPLLGGGLSGFQSSVQPYRDPAYREALIDPHNLFLNFWSETGLLGLLAFVWLSVVAVRYVARGVRGGSGSRALSIGVGAALLAVLVHGLLDVPYFKNDLALVFWVLLAVQVASLARSPRLSRSRAGHGEALRPVVRPPQTAP
jgi:O-antigen ligase